MAHSDWQTKKLRVNNLHLDTKNPRLGRETLSRSPRDIIQYLFEHENAIEVAKSISNRGYFPNEPLLIVREHDRNVVIEGNRRLAALKALLEPGLLEGPLERQLERLSRKFDVSSIHSVPVTIAPSRRATDRQVAGRHIGTPVRAWQAENRASFILEKLSEGYDNDELRDDLGFTLGDIQGARQTRAIAEMARSLDLPDEIKAKVENPRSKIFTTIERVFDSTAGQEALCVKKDSDNGIVGETTKKEFIKGFKKLVEDLALNHESSRTLNKNDDIEDYFKKRVDDEHRVVRKRGSFVPSDIIEGRSVASPVSQKTIKSSKKPEKTDSKTVLPKNFKVRNGSDRLSEIRNELVRIKREEFPNAGAVLLRVFLELSIVYYLKKTGKYDDIVKRLSGTGTLRRSPTLKQLVPSVVEVAKQKLPEADAKKIEKALRYDSAAPFSIEDMHSFVHQNDDMPSARDIQQFWLRTEPLFRLMLEDEDSE